MKYEYKAVETTAGTKKVEEIMNQMAKEGWRVISNTYWFSRDAILITFEREKQF